MTIGSDFTIAAQTGIVRYSSVWEDHQLLEDGLDVGTDDHVLCITSAGCNVLALLLAGARKVTAVDLNPSQTALLELQIEALRRLNHHAEFVELLGARPSARRLSLYETVRPGLSLSARAYWDEHGTEIEAGVMHIGRLERYLEAFRKAYFEPASAAVQRLLAATDLPTQARAFADLATPEFAAAGDAFFSRDALAAGARDDSQFRFVPSVDVAGYFFQRFQWACTAIPVRGNFYLERFLTGGYADLALAPPHLRPRNWDRLRGLVDRVELHTAALQDVVVEMTPGSLDKAGLSNVFEYLSEEASHEVYAGLAARLRPGGRIAYWNLLIDRQSGASLRDRLAPRSELSRQLHGRDRSFFYSAYRVEECLS